MDIREELESNGTPAVSISALIDRTNEVSRIVTQYTGLPMTRARVGVDLVSIVFCGVESYAIGVELRAHSAILFLQSDQGVSTQQIESIEDLRGLRWDLINDFLHGFDADHQL